MITEYGMPKFGLSMEEGTIAEWLVKEGDAVKKGDPIVEVNSEKLTNTGDAPCDGVIRKILAQVDDELPCGEPICLIADSMDEPIPDAAGAAAGTPADTAEAPAPACAAAPAAAPANADVKITPRAKKRAEELGLAYAHIQGTGLMGMITIEDLKKHGRPLAEAAPAAAPANAPAPASAAVTSAPVNAAPVSAAPVSAAPAVYDTAAGGNDLVVKMTPMQSAVCKGMMNSLHGSAQTTIATEADVTSLVKVYKSIKGKYTAAGVKLSYTAMLIKSVAMALENAPKLRTTMVDANHLKTSERIHIGCAVDVPNGLIVPVIRDANLKDLRTICLDLAALTEKAKSGTLAGDDLGGAVTTITNLGMFGVTYFTPVLNAPESTILGVGSIIKKPVERDGGIFMESVMNLSLTHDHRISNGAPCARYLQEVVAGLQDFRWC